MRRTDFCQGWTYRLWGVPGDSGTICRFDDREISFWTSKTFYKYLLNFPISK